MDSANILRGLFFSGSDVSSQVLCLHELNNSLALGQGMNRCASYIPALAKVLERSMNMNESASSSSSSNSFELKLLAIRALNTILDHQPACGEVLISFKIVPIVCENLSNIQDLDVAEQCLKCLELLSISDPRPVLNAGGMRAVSLYFDFFPKHLQLKALTIITNLSEAVVQISHAASNKATHAIGSKSRKRKDADRNRDNEENFKIASGVLESLPSLEVLLESQDEQVLNASVLCYSRLVEGYYISNRVEKARSLKAKSNNRKIPLGWQDEMIRQICSETVVKKMLKIISKGVLGTTAKCYSLFRCFERAIKVSPSLITVMFDNQILPVLCRYLSNEIDAKRKIKSIEELEENIADGLALAYALLPSFPKDSSFLPDEMIGQDEAEEEDGDDVLGYSKVKPLDVENRLADEKNTKPSRNPVTEVSQESSKGADIEDGFWACQICTFHNKVGVHACEMCGQLCPAIKERAADVESDTKRPKLEELLKNRHSEKESDADCIAKLHLANKHWMLQYADDMFPVFLEILSVSSLAKSLAISLTIIATVFYYVPLRVLREIHSKGNLNDLNVIAVSAFSPNVEVVSASLKINLVQFWRLEQRMIVSWLCRQGIFSRLESISDWFKNNKEILQSRSRKHSSLDHSQVFSEKFKYFYRLNRRCNLILNRRNSYSKREKCAVNRRPDVILFNRATEISEKLQSLCLESKSQHNTEIVSKNMEILANPSPVPLRKRRRKSGDSTNSDIPRRMNRPRLLSSAHIPSVLSNPVEREWVSVFDSLAVFLKNEQGLTCNEVLETGLLVSLRNSLANFSEARRAFAHVFSSRSEIEEEESRNNKPFDLLLRTLRMSLDRVENLGVLRFGSKYISVDIGLLNQRVRIRVTPSERTLSLLNRLAFTIREDDHHRQSEDMESRNFTLELMMEPMLSLHDVGQRAWDWIKQYIEQERCRIENTYYRRSTSVLNENFGSVEIGARVVRGRDWRWNNQDRTELETENENDGNEQATKEIYGVIVEKLKWVKGFVPGGNGVRVFWQSSGTSHIYRYGAEGAWDVKLVDEDDESSLPELQQHKQNLGIDQDNTEDFIGKDVEILVFEPTKVRYCWKNASIVKAEKVALGDRVTLELLNVMYSCNVESEYHERNEWILKRSPRLRQHGMESDDNDSQKQRESYFWQDRFTFATIFGEKNNHVITEKSSLYLAWLSTRRPGDKVFVRDFSDSCQAACILKTKVDVQSNTVFSALVHFVGQPVYKRAWIRSTDDDTKLLPYSLKSRISNVAGKTIVEEVEQANLTTTTQELVHIICEKATLSRCGIGQAITQSQFNALDHGSIVYVGATILGEVVWMEGRLETTRSNNKGNICIGFCDSCIYRDDVHISELAVALSETDKASRLITENQNAESFRERIKNKGLTLKGFIDILGKPQQGVGNVSTSVKLAEKRKLNSGNIDKLSASSDGEEERDFDDVLGGMDEELEDQLQKALSMAHSKLRRAQSKAMALKSEPETCSAAEVPLDSIEKSIRDDDDLSEEDNDNEQGLNSKNDSRNDLDSGNSGDSDAEDGNDDKETQRANFATMNRGKRRKTSNDMQGQNSDLVNILTPSRSRSFSQSSDEDSNAYQQEVVINLGKLDTHLPGVIATSSSSRSSGPVSVKSSSSSSSQTYSSQATGLRTQEQKPSPLKFFAPQNTEDKKSELPQSLKTSLLEAIHLLNDNNEDKENVKDESSVKWAESSTWADRVWSTTHYINFEIDESFQEWKNFDEQMHCVGGLVALDGKINLQNSKNCIVRTHFPTITARGVWLQDGEWYYEVEVVRPGLAQIGWADAYFTPNERRGLGCGDDIHSWAYDGNRIMRWNEDSHKWGCRWKAGDIIGCAISINREKGTCTMTYSCNGSFETPMGKAFVDVPFQGIALRPVITFNSSFSCRVLFGDSGGLLPGDKEEKHHLYPVKFDPPGKHKCLSVFILDKGSHILKTSSKRMKYKKENTVENDATRNTKDINTRTKNVLDAIQAISCGSLKSRDETQLHSRRLTQKLIRQLQDPVAVCTRTFPAWIWSIPIKYKFLFPFEARLSLFELTAFGTSPTVFRLGERIRKSESTSPRHRNMYQRRLRSMSGSSAQDFHTDCLARLQSRILNARSHHGSEGSGSPNEVPSRSVRKQKAIVPRTKILESASFLMERPSTQQALLSVEFSGETGHGLGPTREFYSLVCKELQRSELGLWRQIDVNPNLKRFQGSGSGNDAYVFNKQGLFPIYLGTDERKKSKALKYFLLLGRLVGKGFLDGRLLDIPFSLPLCKMLLKEPVNLDDIVDIDPLLGRSLVHLLQLCLSYESLCAQLESGIDVTDKLEKFSAEISNLCIDFTVPGSPSREIVKNGAEIEVTANRLREYLDLITQTILVDDVSEQVDMIRTGIGEIFPIDRLRVFTATELQSLLSQGHAENWNRKTIEQNIVCKHGYNVSSKPVQYLITCMSEFGPEERRLFLRFITGCPRLPIGGWGTLTPRLTIVKKSCTNPDQTLPSCSTCQVYLKLPPYTSIETLRERLSLAIREGQEHFALD